MWVVSAFCTVLITQDQRTFLDVVAEQAEGTFAVLSPSAAITNQALIDFISISKLESQDVVVLTGTGPQTPADLLQIHRQMIAGANGNARVLRNLQKKFQFLKDVTGGQQVFHLGKKVREFQSADSPDSALLEVWRKWILTKKNEL